MLPLPPHTEVKPTSTEESKSSGETVPARHWGERTIVGIVALGIVYVGLKKYFNFIIF